MDVMMRPETWAQISMTAILGERFPEPPNGASPHYARNVNMVVSCWILSTFCATLIIIEVMFGTSFTRAGRAGSMKWTNMDEVKFWLRRVRRRLKRRNCDNMHGVLDKPELDRLCRQRAYRDQLFASCTYELGNADCATGVLVDTDEMPVVRELHQQVPFESRPPPLKLVRFRGRTTKQWSLAEPID
jgi:hypothetical protein